MIKILSVPKKPLAVLMAALLMVLCLTPSALADPEEEETTVIRLGDEGGDVICLQQRLYDLGYFDTTITGTFGKVTEEAVIAFQKQNNLTADGVVGQQTFDVLFGNDAVREPIKAVVKPQVKTSTNKTTVRNGALRDWYSYVNARWSRGEKCQVVDYDTGTSYYMIRVGGTQHADAEPATKDDCAKFLKTYGGSWSWARRAVVVKVDGEWIAGSTNGFPHGYETVENNDMNGQICIHFLNSKNHCHNVVDPTHQAMVRKAAGK